MHPRDFLACQNSGHPAGKALRDVPRMLRWFTRMPPILKLALRDMAYLSAKALLHIGIQHKRISDESERDASRSIASLWRVVELKRIEGDPGTHPLYDHPRWSGAPRCTWVVGGNRYTGKKRSCQTSPFRSLGARETSNRGGRWLFRARFGRSTRA